MPPGWGELVGNLPNLGGWLAFGALALLVIVALVRGDLVPGYIYRREITRGDAAEGRIDAAKARDEAARAAAKVAERAAAAVVRQMREQRGRVADESDEPA